LRGKQHVGSRLWTPQESQIERREHQDDSDIHCQPFLESVSEEREIHTDYDGCHRRDAKYDGSLFAHFSPRFNRDYIERVEVRGPAR
jgi:hypothetical protein